MISTAPNRLFLRGRLRPSESLQRRLRAKIIVSSVVLCVFGSIILNSLVRPQYAARMVIDTGYAGCEHGMIYQRCGGCDDCIPLSTKLNQRVKNLQQRVINLPSDLRRALD